jgi:hypothetical protein
MARPSFPRSLVELQSRLPLQACLDEFTFRFNRRNTPVAAFQTLLGLGSQQSATTYNHLCRMEQTGLARRGFPHCRIFLAFARISDGFKMTLFARQKKRWMRYHRRGSAAGRISIPSKVPVASPF